MSESMIERIARVLYDERMRLWALTAPASLREPPITWESESESFRAQLRREARVATEAVAGSIWQDMVKLAIDEKENPAPETDKTQAKPST